MVTTRMGVAAWTATATLAAALVAPPAGAAGRPTVAGGGWASDVWQGASANTTGTSMADVARIVGATGTGASTLDGRGVGVALVDTGVAPVTGLPSAQVVNGPDLSFESQAPSLRWLDTYGHGTHMAGIIMGSPAAPNFRGIAPKAKLTSVKVANAEGAADVSQIIAAIDWVVAHRNDDPTHPIRVLNLSYGTNGSQNAVTDPLAHAVEQAWRAGIVVVAAAGNGGSTPDRLTNPAYNDYIVAVGSVATKGTVSVADDQLSTFSETSWTRNVDLLAPGESIMSLRNPGSAVDQSYPGARVGEALFRGSGSSQSAAVVSGGVALLLQQRPTMTPDQVKALLKASATRLTAPGQGYTMGLGVLNLSAAAQRAVPATTQMWTRSTGTGSLEAARGGGHVTDKGAALTGENDIFGPLNTADWAARSTARTSWSGGVWMGRRMAGDGWTGITWASRTWGPTTWAGGPWSGGSWADPDWTGRYWSGRMWSGQTWTGRYWASGDWSAARWG